MLGSSRRGVSETVTYVPMWGLLVGFFSFGGIIPTNTIFTCARTS
jgi:hypothetical protein